MARGEVNVAHAGPHARFLVTSGKFLMPVDGSHAGRHRALGAG